VNASNVLVKDNTVNTGDDNYIGIAVNNYSADSGMRDIEIEGNIVSTGNGRGIDIASVENRTVRGVLIEDNVLENNRRGINVQLVQLEVLDVLGNMINNNTDIGVRFSNSATLSTRVALHNNSFAGNQHYGVINGSCFVVDATDNWWGDASGPSTNPDDFVTLGDYVLDPDTSEPADGNGDAVSEDVLFDPWLEQDPFAPDPDPDPDLGPGDVNTPDFDAQAIEQLLLPSITAAPTVVSGAGTAITPGFVTQGTAADLAGAKDAYQASQQALNDNRANMTPAEIAVADLDLAVANAAILALELVLGTGATSLAAAVAAYQTAVAAFAANGGLLTPAQQAAVAEVLAEVAAALTARGAVL